MMLTAPKKNLAMIIAGRMKPKGYAEGGYAEGGEVDNSTLYKAMAADILKAVDSKDAGLLGDTLHAFFELCDSEPHEEGPHEGEE